MPYNQFFTETSVDTVATPVTIGNVAGLFGIETPEGRGILFWCTARFQAQYPLGGQSMYYAVVDSPADFMTNGIISSTDQIHLIDCQGNVDDYATYGGNSINTGNSVVHPTGFVENNHVSRPSVSMIDGTLVLAMGTYEDGDIRTRVYLCNNPDSFPLDFTYVADLAPATTVSTGFVRPYPASGSFYAISPTRWVYVGGWFDDNGGVPRSRYGVWHSDNGGHAWTNDIVTSFGDLFGRVDRGYQAPQIEFDPQSELFFFTQFGVAGTPTMFDVWASPDGASWTKTYSYAPGVQLGGIAGHGFVNDGTNAYILSNQRVRRLTDLATWTGEEVGNPGTGAGLFEIQMARRVLVTNGGNAYYFYGDDNVSAMGIPTEAGGWIVGAIGFHTPDLCG